MPNETWAMAYKFIYFVMMLLTFRSRSIGTYFLSDELDTNLPEQLGDRVDENWQDKRSVENDYSDGINRASSDYRDGNAETVVDGTPESEIFRRESESERNVDESMDEDAIREILSQFSDSDRMAFDGLMNDKNIDVNKRQLLKQNFENNFHLRKRNNIRCTGPGCDEYEQIPVDDQMDNCPEKVDSKRKSKFKRSSRFRGTPRENILQAKISILKENFKRNSEMRMMEDSAMKKYSKSKRKLENDRRGR